MYSKYAFNSKGYNFAKAVHRALGESFVVNARPDGVLFVDTNETPLIKLVDHTNYFEVIFYYPVPDLNKTVTFQHSQKNNHHQDCWVYSGQKVSEVITLVHLMRDNYLRHIAELSKEAPHER